MNNDLTIKNIYEIFGTKFLVTKEGRRFPDYKELDEINFEDDNKGWMLEKGKSYLVEVNEKLNLIKDKITWIVSRSTMGRGGCIVPSFCVKDTYSKYNKLTISLFPIMDLRLDKDSRIAKVIYLNKNEI